MEHPGRDPLRGKFTRFLQESIKRFKIDYFRKSEHRPVSLEALWQIQADRHRGSTSAQGFDFQWEALGEAYRSLPRSYQEVLRKIDSTSYFLPFPKKNGTSDRNRRLDTFL